MQARGAKQLYFRRRTCFAGSSQGDQYVYGLGPWDISLIVIVDQLDDASHDEMR